MSNDTPQKKKQYKKKSTSPRAKKVIQKMVENGGKSSVSAAMREAGYSEAYAHNPQKFTAAKSVRNEFADYFPKSYVYSQLQKLHNAHRLSDMMFPVVVSDEEIVELLHSVNCEVKKIKETKVMKYVWFWSPDNRALKDALDMSFKIMGEYTAEKNNPANPLREMSDEELMAEINNSLKVFKKK